MLNEELNRISGTEISPKAESAALFGLAGEDKVEAFEAALFSKLHDSDKISEAVETMVRAALSVEFGEKILGQKRSANMVRVISDSILCDSDLRKQALLIIDRITKAEELNA